MMELKELISILPPNDTVVNNFITAYSKINSPLYEKIVCTISGGRDSDTILDICTKCDKDGKIEYVWFDTGLEYQATKDHLSFLEQKYGIKIKPYAAIKPIPTTCKKYGLPFISKKVSNYIKRLQKHNFQWEDKPLEELLAKYCKWDKKKNDWIGCKAALRFWCNDWGENSKINISNNKWLKEFLIDFPPEEFGIQISDDCCKYAKKDVVHKLIKENGYQLNINGIRKAEGGQRSTAYKNCFDENEGECDNYRPIFFYKNSTRSAYENHFRICNSKCYSEYGLDRTGCAGCPFGREFEKELEVIKKYEPRLYKAVNNIFGLSYEYTRLYRDYQKYRNEEEKRKKADLNVEGQISMKDYEEGTWIPCKEN